MSFMVVHCIYRNMACQCALDSVSKKVSKFINIVAYNNARYQKLNHKYN